MIYMSGDNNLAVDMAYAMEQIREVAKIGAKRLDLFVYYDGNSPEIPTVYCDFSNPDDPKYFRSCMVPDKLYPVPAKLNENAADRRSVLNFVDWCVNRPGQRSKRHALIFSGHSLGFEDRGLFRDESSGRSMKISDLFFLIQRIVLPKPTLEEIAATEKLKGEELERETTELIGRPLDILGFDSCVMGMLEVGYQFSDVTETMIASEGSVPSAGWTYAKILGGLAAGRFCRSSAKKVAEHFVKEFISSQDRYTVGGVSVDMAAWDMSRFRDLADALDGLAQVLIECFRNEDSRIYRLMERVVLQAHWKCQSYMLDQNVDLGDLCELLKAEVEMWADDLGSEEPLLREVAHVCDNVLAILRKTVILSGFSGGGYQYSNGVSVFFPWSWNAYLVSQKNYESTWYAKDSKNNNFAARWLGWADFLKLYLGKVARRSSAPLSDGASSGEKYRYLSGIRFADEDSIGGDAETAVSSRLGGSGSSTKLGGSGSSTKLGGSGSSTKLGGSGSSTKLGGSGSSTKLGGSGSSTKLGGSGSSTKLGGSGSSTKLGGSGSSTKLGGSGSSTKLGGSVSSTKLGGLAADSFFTTLRLFKNIESDWNISGFSKRPDDSDA